ncbi:fibronectin type III domain-containing protein [Pectobacterium versatile]|uniref:fibronectin type III domain-containing protein n=1 Tax=Pectobacterium versatile TaxID=2488639 RepID=UPI001CCCA00E|nr:carbohydrate-binding protein [Pectobacterium versatile]
MTTIYTPYVDVTVNANWSSSQDYPNGLPNLLYFQQAKKWGANGLIFAFITLSPSKNACWAGNDAMPLNWALPLANQLNDANMDVVVSFGGAVNADISTHFSGQELINIYQKVIDDYSVAGLDFDLENGLYNVSHICTALKTIQRNNPQVRISFTLPTMPTGMTATGLGIVQSATEAGLDFIVNGMAMDYYNPAYKDAMGQAAIDAATSIKGQINKGYNHVAITPMIGLNDDRTMFTLEDATELATFAEERSFSFLASWSFNRDNPSSYSYVDLVSSSNPAQKIAGEYCQRFVDAFEKTISSTTLRVADVTENSITLGWDPVLDQGTVSEYIIYENGKKVESVPSTTLIYTAEQLKPDTKYSYFVTFKLSGNSEESNPSNSVQATTLPANPGEYPQWKLNTYYSVGAKVTNLGRNWICIQAHTSYSSSWQPGGDDYKTLWQLIG